MSGISENVPSEKKESLKEKYEKLLHKYDDALVELNEEKKKHEKATNYIAQYKKYIKELLYKH